MPHVMWRHVERITLVNMRLIVTVWGTCDEISTGSQADSCILQECEWISDMFQYLKRTDNIEFSGIRNSELLDPLTPDREFRYFLVDCLMIQFESAATGAGFFQRF